MNAESNWLRYAVLHKYSGYVMHKNVMLEFCSRLIDSSAATECFLGTLGACEGLRETVYSGGMGTDNCV